MSEIVEVAQVLRVSLDGVQVAMQITGAFWRNGKDFFKVLWNVLHQDKLQGKTSMRDILLRGGDLQIFQFPVEKKEQIYKALKGYGVLFAELPDLNRSDGWAEVVFHAEATPRVNSLIMNLELGRLIDMDEYLDNAESQELQNQRDEFDEAFQEEEKDKKLSPEEREEVSNRMRILNAKENPTKEDITITRKLVVNETKDGYYTRIPYEMNQFFWLSKKDGKWINEGKTLLAMLDKNREYEILDKNGKPVQKLNGESLYKQHYDEVSIATKKRVLEQENRRKREETRKRQQKRKNQRRRN